MKKIIILLFFVFVLSFQNLFSQQSQIDSSYKKEWFISLSGGVQMSGIKSEDFISHNIAPALRFSGGVWFTPEIALQFGYKGFYFNTIADSVKHHYNYFFGEVLINLNNLFRNANDRKSKWSLIIHPGAGLFYNIYYGQPNICAHIGFLNKVDISIHINVFADISFIMGWDIYQGDEDILPSCMVGINYIF